MRRFLIPALIVAALFSCAFVPAVDRTLARCRDATPAITKQVGITLNSRPGRLVVGEPGKHSLVFDDGGKIADPGLEAMTGEAAGAITNEVKPLTSFFRLMDFHSPGRPTDLIELLPYSGIDANRRGWVRLDEKGDRLAVTIGALGESEADFPQLWIDRATGRIARLSLPDGTSALVGPAGQSNLPQFVVLDRGNLRLQFTQPETPAKKK